jgi:hypothetical protein
MIRFTQFLTDLNSCVSEAIRLIESADTVEWDPSVGKEFAGTGGITTSSGHRRSPTRQQTQKAKTGDVVIVKDPSGKMMPGLITSIEGDMVVIVNPQRHVKVQRPLGSLNVAPDAMANQLKSKYPNKSVWLYDERLNVPL